VLDSTARSDDLPMRPGIPPFFLVKLVWGSVFLIYLSQFSPGLLRTPILCSHFPHGNEHVMTCLARLFLASCTALELIQEPRHSLLSPSRNRNSAAQVVAAGLFQFSASWSWSMHLLPQCSVSIKSLRAPALADCLMLRHPTSAEIRKFLFQLVPTRSNTLCF